MMNMREVAAAVGGIRQGEDVVFSSVSTDTRSDLAGKLSDLPMTNKVEERAFKRIFLSAACEAETDSQGRILIPQHLKDYAGITRDVVILGVLHHVEIWAKTLWTQYHQKARQTFEKVAPHFDL